MVRVLLNASKLKITPFIFFGVFVHLILLYSIFEIYYSSPIVAGAKIFPITTGNAPASRLLFISADGLRWRTFFENPNKSSFMQSLIKDGKTSWGISQSHVPTESRPGHVALMAGLYEDVSAVAKGWRYNPVEFDSIANRTSNLWMWGSHDITSLFADAKNSKLVHWGYYSGEEEDFSSDKAHELDNWVFNNVERYLADANVTKQIFAEKSLFFLHLLGLDTNGHGAKPHSDKYIDNIRVVDEGIKRIVELFQRIFKDDRTSFIFTADHGMTDWGAHGSGSDDEIYVPFVAWGAGIHGSTARLSSPIKQVDIAPLQAALLGTAIPANSMGILPLSILNASSMYRFKAMYANFKQMVEQYRIKREERRANSLPFMFRDFDEFPLTALTKVDVEIRRLAESRRFDAAAAACVEWIPRVRDALIYFHRYKRFSLGLAITALYASWNLLVYCLVAVKRQPIRKMNDSKAEIFKPNSVFIVVLAIGAFAILYQRLPLTNYLYYLMPIYTFSIAYNILIEGLQHDSSDSNNKIWLHWLTNAETFMANFFNKGESRLFAVRRIGIHASWLCFLGFILAVFVGVFYDRRLLSLGFLLISPLWTIMEWADQITLHPDARKWKLIWSSTCVVLCVFPLMDTVGNSPRPLLVAAAPFLGIALMHMYLNYCTNRKSVSPIFKRLQQLYALAGGLLICNAVFTNALLSLLLRIFSWSSLAIAVLLPMLEMAAGSNDKVPPVAIADRLAIWMASLFLAYSMLSVAYESIFLLVFCVFLFALFRLEFSGHLNDLQTEKADDTNQNEFCFASSGDAGISGSFSFAEWRRAFLLVAVVEMAFFGTGNIASLNSFNTDSIRNFVTVFSPFLMAALLIAKILLPFLQMSLTFAAILTQQLDDAFQRLAALLMFITDAMAVVFFYNLKDEGSWLDIGLSISNYVISVVSSISVFILLHVARMLIHFHDRYPKIFSH